MPSRRSTMRARYHHSVLRNDLPHPTCLLFEQTLQTSTKSENRPPDPDSSSLIIQKPIMPEDAELKLEVLLKLMVDFSQLISPQILFTTFRSFKLLPIEVRLMIWSEAYYNNSGGKIELHHQLLSVIRRKAPTPPQPIFACKESKSHIYTIMKPIKVPMWRMFIPPTPLYKGQSAPGIRDDLECRTSEFLWHPRIQSVIMNCQCLVAKDFQTWLRKLEHDESKPLDMVTELTIINAYWPFWRPGSEIVGKEVSDRLFELRIQKIIGGSKQLRAKYNGYDYIWQPYRDGWHLSEKYAGDEVDWKRRRVVFKELLTIYFASIKKKEGVCKIPAITVEVKTPDVNIDAPL